MFSTQILKLNKENLTESMSQKHYVCSLRKKIQSNMSICSKSMWLLGINSLFEGEFNQWDDNQGSLWEDFPYLKNRILGINYKNWIFTTKGFESVHGLNKGHYWGLRKTVVGTNPSGKGYKTISKSLDSTGRACRNGGNSWP